MSCIHFQHVSEKETGHVHVNNFFFFFFFFFFLCFFFLFFFFFFFSTFPTSSPYFQLPPPLDLFSNLTIGLQKPWDRLRPMLWCHHRLRLTLWRPRHHKQHNLQQKYPPTSRRRKVPQKERPPHQPQTQRSQVSLFFSFLMLLIISGLICLWYLIPRRLLCQRQTSRHFLCNLSVSLCWQNEYS